MIDIYNTDKTQKIELVCRKSIGDPNDKFGRYFERNKKYKATIEPLKITDDTNNQKCTLVWINYNKGYGNRFTIVGNIFHSGVPYWDSFKKYFYCPLELERNKKIKKLKTNKLWK